MQTVKHSVNYAAVDRDTVIADSPCYYHGYIVTTSPANICYIRDGQSGTIIDSIPASTAVGTQKVLPAAVRINDQLFFDVVSTESGTLIVLYS